ncbi:hypothetical protein M405DRAFT_782001 [Rhizopogon salebrosus TDB-379]|nr:hypothetical protein M405DRAFT_782001 [Rhizopogon salebrosus TDB-379]
MNEDNCPSSWKKPWELLKRSHSLDPQFLRQGAVGSGSMPSLLTPSQSGPRRGRHGLFRKLWTKVIKTRYPQRAGRSANPEPTAASLRARDLSVETCRDLSPYTALAPNASPAQMITPGAAKAEPPDPRFSNERLADVSKDVAPVIRAPGIIQNISLPSTSSNLKSDPHAIDPFPAILESLKVFNSVVDEIADLDPYAKTALSILTRASKMILNQANLDGAALDLLSKISAVYVLTMESDSLARLPFILEIFTTMARHTLKCAEFVVHYSETKSFWKRNKHASKGADAGIDSYSTVLEGLVQQFRIGATTREPAGDSDLSSMEYVAGAGLDTSKRCLHDTRNDLLSEIKSWIRTTGEDVPRVLWLSGAAGKGKSSIAHTIASWSSELGGLGACFCFDLTRQADHPNEKIFTTIAHDFAERNPVIRRALVLMLHDDEELGKTTDLVNQWQKFVEQPIGMAVTAAPFVAPVLIVIDALDESGDAHSRKDILRVLAGTLPANFRILVTSRPLEDICQVLDAASHVRHVSMDDIPAASTEHDIQLYVSSRLADSCSAFDDARFKALAHKSDGLFEWARLACEYIKSAIRLGVDPMDRFNAVVSGTFESRTGTHLLDHMYGCILREIITEDEEAVVMFRSVMGQILASLEPLSVITLTAMRLHFRNGDERYGVERIIGRMGSLVTGTADPQTFIRPLHVSFYDFLTDKSRSENFFIDVSSVKRDLAFASLRVMRTELRFNICSLENSYQPNSAVVDLETRVKEFIPAELSYSCRFWGMHVRATSFEPSLAMEVEAFFDGERLLFWLEALALMRDLSGAVRSLSAIADWVKVRVSSPFLVQMNSYSCGLS